MQMEKFSYDNKIVRAFLIASVLWGIVGILVGLFISLELIYPNLGLSLPWLSYGRLRPLHTNAVIFAFVGNGMFFGIYYSLQRLLKARMFNDFLSWLHFWGWQSIIVSAALTLPFGITTSKEYAELEWPLDLLVVVWWVLWGVAMFGMIGIRRERTLYVSVWYYMSSFLAVAMLYLFNNMEVPTYFASGGHGSILHSVSMYAGTNDALVQWWFGHNAVAFVFTTPIIAIVYYFLPKESGQNVYSYKLSMLAFWGLMFVYLWAGGHHLIYSTVPDWMQTMGSVMSVVLILPSWGSAINMLLTMKGEWGQLQTNPLIKFMVMASTFYMLSTIEGPIQAIKSVNAIAHFTDWIPGHVHDGVLGWVVFMVMASLLHMAPRMYKREIYSKSLLETQFWIQTVAIVLYFTSMWIAGITQGMMWRAYDEYGSLVYSFIDTVEVLHPYYTIRAVGGLLYLVGLFMWAYNMYKTATAGRVLTKEPVNASPMGA